jgi:DNA-binding transcriptional ArsR family regulator
MSLTGVLERLGEEPEGPEALRLAAAELGRALARPSRPSLRAFQVALARGGAGPASASALAERPPGRPSARAAWAQGVREALLEVLAAFEDERAREQAEREVDVRALRGEWRRALPLLQGEPFRPGELQERLGRDKTQVSHLLRELAAAALVELLPAREGEDGRARLYQLTLRGEALARRAGEAAGPPSRTETTAPGRRRVAASARGRRGR